MLAIITKMTLTQVNVQNPRRKKNRIFTGRKGYSGIIVSINENEILIRGGMVAHPLILNFRKKSTSDFFPLTYH